MAGDCDLLASKDAVYVTVGGASGFSWYRGCKLRWKKEGNITVQLYKAALRTGHSEAICNC